jgi:hypothetical protein
VPLAAGITAGIGNLTIKFTSTFSITGIAAGTLIVIIGYHAVRPFAQRSRDQSQGAGSAYADAAGIPAGRPATPQGEAPASRAGPAPHAPGADQPAPAEDDPGGSAGPDKRSAAP